MPEGDTIHLSAKRLDSMLGGRRVRRIDVGPRAMIEAAARWEGKTIESVEARGKHLLVRFSDGRWLHSHMGMTGSWHRYRRGETWRKPERLADLVLEIEGDEGEDENTLRVAVCFTPAVLESLTADALRRHGRLSRLGPDLLSEEFDFDAVRPRLKGQRMRSIGECLLDQTIACGIGNIYKSESLFLAKIHPETPVALIPEAALRSLYERARRLMQSNYEGFARRTRPRGGPKLWVYERRGAPCARCGTPISVKRQGDLGRTSYWCESCQPRVE